MSIPGEAIVSSDRESLILVDENDVEIGQMSKRECHLGEGVLHRAFSIFIFNEVGDVLLQKRSSQKFLWPGFWSNACCSHPRAGESLDEAVHRRLEQELGIATHLNYLYKFIYKARFGDVGVEHELCSVWTGTAESDQVRSNRNEIEDWCFVTKAELETDLDRHPERYTPWMKMEWRRILDDFS
ncbi:MAG: isopentenyl-diphosphate Delta-isomerase [Pseudomonadales bacterium]|nr:isopentenyl-diphosphate Delta-isomerase [Pseudomonadales bacterium]